MRIATATDIPDLVRLINLAYRVEDEWIDGDRTFAEEIQGLMETGVFLIKGDQEASVYVKVTGDRGYFGMLSVDPTRQKQGLGAKMIDAAERYCRDRGCAHMDITVIELRTDLPRYYGQFGYTPNGKENFPAVWKMRRPFQLLKMTKRL